jgi:hypothetical protein
MKIGVVSDTHMPAKAKKLPDLLVQGLQGVDYILHAGDWVSLDVADLLGRIAPVDGIAGNNDGEKIRTKFGRKKIITLGGRHIGLVHGDGTKKTTEERAWEAFHKDDVDLIIFGHSHIPVQMIRKGVLMFNPGSPTDKRRQPLYSYGIIELGPKIHAKHYFYENKS